MGLFRAHRRYDFFGGGHFGQMGPFYAHFGPGGSRPTGSSRGSVSGPLAPRGSGKGACALARGGG